MPCMSLVDSRVLSMTAPTYVHVRYTKLTCNKDDIITVITLELNIFSKIPTFLCSLRQALSVEP